MQTVLPTADDAMRVRLLVGPGHDMHAMAATRLARIKAHVDAELRHRSQTEQAHN